MRIGYLGHFRAHGVGNGIVPKILVAGKSVADIRKYFTIKIPALGGTPVEMKEPPALEILKCILDDDVLRIITSCSEDTAKLEIYIDGKFYASVAGKAEIAADVADIEGIYVVRVVAYDKFMYYSAQEFEVAF